MKKKSPLEFITKIIDEYDTNIREELRNLWNNSPIDLTKKEVNEVICGIIARQVTISIQFMSSVSSWTNDIAPIIFRTMADNYINLKWILGAPLERSRLFILYGLGQEKLMVEHRRIQIEQEGGDPATDELIQFSESWINSQRYTFLTEINLGSWSTLSTRQMAEEANCIDFYNYVYQPFSSATHNTWNHIGKYNVNISDNILHKFLRVPFVPKTQPFVGFIETAARYTKKCFDDYYLAFPNVKQAKSAYDTLFKRLFKNRTISKQQPGCA